VRDTWDVFVSYAHADDEVPEGARAGWVTTLVTELSKILRRKLGGSGAQIWMDHQLAADQNVTQELLAKLRASRTFVLVMSPGYQQSRWTQRELANFLLSSQMGGPNKNVFIVEIEPIERTAWPRGLRDLELTPVRFWHRGFEDAVPELLGYPLPPVNGASPYWRNLTQLAHWIADRLKDKQPQHATQSPIVLVAEATDDLDQQRTSLVSLLEQHQFEAVPVSGYPRDTEAAFRKALLADLRDAALFVQLLGPYQGKALSEGGTPVEIQARLAIAAHEERALRILQWRDPALDLQRVSSGAHRALLAGPFVHASGFEQFRQAILHALDAAPPTEAPVHPVAHLAGGPLRILVDADPVDEQLAAAACDSLKSQNVDAVPWQPAASAGSFVEALEQQGETVRHCDGVLFVYGRTTLSWLNAQFAYTARTMGLGGAHVWGAVLDGPPASEGKVPFRSRHLLNLDCREGFDPAALTPLLTALRPRAEHVRA
jgi:hypothetical protein